jgi:hypothetical protein
MALSINEVEWCYRELSGLARQHGLDWVVTQAESEIALGKITSGKVRAKEVPLHDASLEEIQKLSKGRPTKFTVSEEFTPAEKLRILIEALRHAVRGVWEISLAVSESMANSIPGLEKVQFVPEGISKEAFALDTSEILSRKHAAHAFDELIHEIEEAI